MKSWVWIAVLCGAVGCSSGTGKQDAGGVEFVVSSGSALTAANVTRVNLWVSGPVSLSQDLTLKDGKWQGRFSALPAGSYWVTATAFGSPDGGPERVLYSGGTSLTIAPQQSVTVHLPLNDVESVAFGNSAPRIGAVVLSETETDPAHAIDVRVDASDPEGSPLQYAWSASPSCGSFDDAGAASTVFRPSSCDGPVVLTVAVSDSPQNAAPTASAVSAGLVVQGRGSLAVDVAYFNSRPDVLDVAVLGGDAQLTPGQAVGLSVLAVDDDGDPLTYEWSSWCDGAAPGAWWDERTAAPTWLAPDVPEAGSSCELRVAVTDPRGARNEGWLRVQIAREDLSGAFAPVVVSAYQSAPGAAPGEAVFLSVTANSPNGTPIDYLWDSPYAFGGGSAATLWMPSCTPPEAVVVPLVLGTEGGYTRRFEFTVACRLPGDSGWTGVVQYGTPGRDDGRGHAVDSNGDVIVGGTTDSAYPGFTNAGGTDVAILKFSRAGQLLWTKQFGTAGGDSVTSVATGPGDEIYVLGSFGGASPAGWLRVLDANGNDLWGTPFDATWTDSLAVDGFGNAYVTANAANGSFLAKIVPGGAFAWRLDFPALYSSDWGIALGVDGAGNVVTGGVRSIVKRSPDGQELWRRDEATYAAFGLAVDFDGTIYASHPGWEPSAPAAVRKLSPSGDVLWTTEFMPFGIDAPHGVALSGGALYVAGMGLPDGFLAKLDPWTGAVEWTRTVGTDAFDMGCVVAADGEGGAIIPGFTEGSFPGYTLQGPTDNFLAKFDSAGNLK